MGNVADKANKMKTGINPINLASWRSLGALPSMVSVKWKRIGLDRRKKKRRMRDNDYR